MTSREIDYLIHCHVLGRETKTIGLIGSKPYGELYAEWSKMPRHSDDPALVIKLVACLSEEIEALRKDRLRIANENAALVAQLPVGFMFPRDGDCRMVE